MKSNVEPRIQELEHRGAKGFTLMEMLIVIAIMAILIAIAIPTFSYQVEISREATDAANIRATYAEVVASALSKDQKKMDVTLTYWPGEVQLTQQIPGWQNGEIAKEPIGSTTFGSIEGEVGPDKVVTMRGNADGSVKITCIARTTG